jgi:hypothetical protein
MRMPTGDLNPVDLGQVEVEEDKVVLIDLGQVQCLLAVVGRVGGIPLPPQTAGEGIRQILLVLYD